RNGGWRQMRGCIPASLAGHGRKKKMIAAPLSFPHDDPARLLGEPLFLREVEWELARATRRGPGTRSAGSGCLAYLEFNEPAQRRGPWGERDEEEVARQVALLLRADARRLEIAGRDAERRKAT